MKLWLRTIPLLLLFTGAAIDWLGTQLGLWWVLFVVGFVIGVVLQGGWRIILISLLTGISGWSLPLLTLVLRGAPINQTAGAIEGIFGLPGMHGLSAFTITLFFAVVLSLLGSWVGSAVRKLMAPRKLRVL